MIGAYTVIILIEKIAIGLPVITFAKYEFIRQTLVVEGSGTLINRNQRLFDQKRSEL
jgi:hypothetical protein